MMNADEAAEVASRLRAMEAKDLRQTIYADAISAMRSAIEGLEVGQSIAFLTEFKPRDEITALVATGESKAYIVEWLGVGAGWKTCVARAADPVESAKSNT